VRLARLLRPHGLDPVGERLLEVEQLAQEVRRPVGLQAAPDPHVAREVPVELDNSRLEGRPRLGLDGLGKLVLGLDLGDVGRDLVE
jgi:hypothetical protein